MENTEKEMENIKIDKTKVEYLCIVVATWFHGMITQFALGCMPLIGFEQLIQFHKETIIAFLLWFCYGFILCMVIQFSQIKNRKLKVQVFIALIGGLFTVVGKSGLDYIGNLMVLNKSMKEIAIFDGCKTIVFGVLLIIFLHVVIAQKRVIFRNKTYIIPLVIIGAIVAIYILLVVNFLSNNQKAIELYSANAEQIMNLDYHFAFKILKINPCTYSLIYIMFWWFSNRITKSVVTTDEQAM